MDTLKNYVDWKLAHSDKIANAEGYPCILKKSKKGSLKELVIEGNTGKNLIPYPYTKANGALVPTTQTESGVTFTINEDRSITVNGTATDTIYYHLVSTYGTHKLILPQAKYYFRDNCNDINSTPGRFSVHARAMDDSKNFVTTIGEGTFDTSSIQSCKIWLSITITKGNVFENITFKPQLELGSTATEYEPYKAVGDLITDGDYAGKYKIPLTVSGKNLFDTQGWYNWLRSFTTTYVTKKTVDGTNCIYYRPAVTYDKNFMEGCFKENTQYVLTFRAKGIVGSSTSTGFEFNYTDNRASRIYISNTDSWNNYTLISAKNKTIKYIKMTYNYEQGCYFDENSIQLELGSTATEYEPYKEPMITSIYLGNPLGSGECLDFKRQKLIKATSQTDVALPKVQVFKGTSVIRTDTEVSPTNIKAKYIKY